jgi:hypothetical protein
MVRDVTKLASGTWCASRGTADTIELISRDRMEAIFAGAEVRFRATGANTGAATIALNGLAPVSAVTVTGAALPAGYIRTDVDTVAVYDGANWVVSRAPERGSGANGTFLRLDCGCLHCWHDIEDPSIAINQAYLGGFASFALNGSSWAYPAAFSSPPSVVGMPVDQSAAGVVAGSVTSVGATLFATAFASQAAGPVSIKVTASGDWYA